MSDTNNISRFISKKLLILLTGPGNSDQQKTSHSHRIKWPLPGLPSALALVLGFALVSCGTGPTNREIYKQFNTSPQTPAHILSGYELVWQDEFDGSEIDRGKWNFRAEGTVRALATVSRRTISLDGRGHLSISVVKDADGKYHVGQLGTEGLFETTYGYFECRARMNSQVGPHVAFWLQSPDMNKGGDPAANGAEIDIFEYHRRTPGIIYHTVHWGGYGQDHRQEGAEISVAGIESGFHTFGLEWTPDEYIFYIDGKETWRTRTAVSRRPQYLILSTELTGWGGDPALGVFPDAVVYDYVRVYKRKADIGASSGFKILRSEFIFEQAPFASCHASTIVESDDGLLAAWFGGSAEGAKDVGIWMARFDGKKWSAPQEVATGIVEEPASEKPEPPQAPGHNGRKIMTREKESAVSPSARRYPCWNPVLFKKQSGEMLLFYKVGPSPASWWGMLKISRDDGRTWSKAYRLPEGILGPIKNKPVELEDGPLLCGSSTEDKGWQVHMEWTENPLEGWHRSPALNTPPDIQAIQPAILKHPDGRFQILCRSKQGRLMEAWSEPSDPTRWTQLKPTEIPNPDSGIDALTLRDGRHLLVYNPIKQGRHILAVAESRDGKTWEKKLELENETGAEFSYPAVIQAGDGLVHISYTWKRQRLKHVVLAVE
ncbi:MAG: exo-alpha-sialidase [Candidatus Saccharicenans sp.]|nr:exo-alpha-sialidase [Candidatus Saccharicenans sp.]